MKFPANMVHHIEQSKKGYYAQRIMLCTVKGRATQSQVNCAQHSVIVLCAMPGDPQASRVTNL